MKIKLDKYNNSMEYKETNKEKGQLLGNKDIKLSFLKKEHEINKETGEITCRLTCKINLSDIENKFFKFSDKIRRMIVDGILETYTLTSTEPKTYHIQELGEILTVQKQVLKRDYNYFDTFTVTAKVKVNEGDEFNETTGKIISETKAKMKAYKRAYILFKRLTDMFGQISKSFNSYAEDMLSYTSDENYRYLTYAGIDSDIDSDFDEYLENQCELPTTKVISV